MASAEHLDTLDRISTETQRDGRGALEAMCREAGKWDQPLEALEMYAEAKAFMEQEVAELVQLMRTLYEPPFAWDEIAERLGMSRQSAWTKYRPSEEGTVRLRQRPGPRGDADLVVFQFTVNDSYAKNGEITIPTGFNAALDERLPGDGPSWGAMLEMGDRRGSAKVRRGHTRGKRYYQVRVPKDLRSRLALRPGAGVPIRIPLLGSLVVRLGGDAVA